MLMNKATQIEQGMSNPMGIPNAKETFKLRMQQSEKATLWMQKQGNQIKLYLCLDIKLQRQDRV